MSLSVTNTLSGEREEFTADDEVLMYVCGLTVSDDAHLGHARAWVHADIVHRWLSYLGYDVRHVENVTDVNEKIVARVGEDDLGGSESAVARRFTASVLDDMRGLNLLRAEVYPRVSEHVPEIISLIERLVERGYAYESDGSVYFDVSEFSNYGALSNQSVEALEAEEGLGAREEKRDPADFALWKAGGVSDADVAEHRSEERPVSDHGETWASPWGEGRPGWHIECSAMSTTHLGDTLDIHLGGRDLVFPHHENEIAQSEAATGERFVRYWMHVGLLNTKGEKMSSSLGNFTTVAEALDEHGPNVLRSFYLGAQYRTDQVLSGETLAEARERWERLERAHRSAVEACDSVEARTKVEDEALRTAVAERREAFEAAMNDDFNVREAATALLELARAVNRHVDAGEPFDYRGLREAVEAFEELGGGVFGLQFGAESEGRASVADDLVSLLLDVRERERAAGNWERSDEIRDELAALGVEVEDSEEGPAFRFE